jgi:hypothetical protein
MFSPAPTVTYRRPARDHNYEFWGDQTFYGENPPQAAVVSWYLKKAAGDVKLKITDAATGKEVREISGQVLANSNKAGMQAACWDLRVQPVPTPTPGQRGAGAAGGRGGEGGAPAGAPQGGGRGDAGGGTPAVSPFGAGCGTTGGAGGGGGFGGGGTAGPFVLPGTYIVALVVDGKTVGTSPLKVAADAEVALAALERKKLFDMAMEMHHLQALATQVSDAVTPLNARMGELAKEIAGHTDLPADVKASFDALQKEIGAIAPKFVQAAGGGRGGAGGGGGRGGATENLLTRIGLAKNGLMGGISPGEQTTRAYNEMKAQVPKAMADANVAIAKASSLSSALAKYKLTLVAPEPVKLPASIAAEKK